MNKSVNYLTMNCVRGTEPTGNGVSNYITKSNSFKRACGSADYDDVYDSSDLYTNVSEMQTEVNVQTIHISPVIDSRLVHDGTILIRVMKSTESITIPPRSGAVIETNINLSGSLRGSDVCYQITRLSPAHWLGYEFGNVLLVRSGTISLAYFGKISVQLFNRTTQGLRISKNSAICQLEARLYDYER